MKYFMLSCITIASVLCQNAFAGNLPVYLSVCNRDPPKLSQCFKEKLQNMGPHLANGIREFQIPPMSKLVIPSIHLGQFNTSDVNINVTLKNIKFGGLEKYEVVDAELIPDPPFIFYQLRFQELLLEFIDRAKGKALGTTLDGEANVTSKNKDAIVTCEWEGEKYSQGGKDYLKFKIKNQSSVVSYLEADVTGFFKHDPELDGWFNQTFNDNIALFRPEMQFSLAKIVCEAFTTYQNKVFSLFDLEQLFPSN